MDFSEIFFSEIIGYAVSIIIALAIIFFTFGFNQIRKVIKEYFGLDLAEAEVYHVARRALKLTSDHNEIVEYTLNIVSERLKEKNIKISKEELQDIIENTLEDLKEEE